MQSREEILLGTILNKPETYMHAMIVLPNDFKTNNHSEVWKEVQAAYERGTLSRRSIIEALRERKVLDTIGDGTIFGEEYLSTLADDQAGIKDNVNAVVDAGVKEQLKFLAGFLKNASMNGKPYAEIIDDTMQKLIEARRISDENAPREIGYYLPDYVDRTERLREGKEVPGWAPALDPVKGFFGVVDPKEFMIVAGSPGGGKSSYLRYEGLMSAMRGEVVLTFNGENDEAWFLSFAAANISGVDTNEIKNPSKMSNKSWTEFNRALEKVKSLKWIIAPMRSAQEMRFIAKQVMAQYGRLDLIQVDQVSNMADISYEGIEKATYDLRNIASDVLRPVMAAHQLKKADKTQPNRMIDQEDLLFGGQRAAKKILIIKPQKLTDAEAAMFPRNLDRDGRLIQERNRPGVVVKMDVVKNTSGSMGITGDIFWDRGTNRFQPLEERWRGTATTAVPARQAFTPKPKPVRF